jgi:hypothetical protein
MSWPPMLMHVRIRNKDTHFGIWLPLFLIFLVPLVILIALSPLIFLCILLAWPSGWGRWMWETIKAGFVTVWNLKGLKVDIQGRDIVQVSIV